MEAILELETQWQSIKSDPSNLYDLPPNPNGNMIAHLNLGGSQSTPTQPKINIDFVSPMKRQLNALNTKSNSRKVLDVEDVVNTNGGDLGKSEIANAFFNDSVDSGKK